MQRADERLCQKGGHDRGESEHADGRGKGPAALFRLGGRIELPLPPKLKARHGHADGDQHYRERKGERR